MLVSRRSRNRVPLSRVLFIFIFFDLVEMSVIAEQPSCASLT